MRLRIENERLKKGYFAKGDDSKNKQKEFEVVELLSKNYMLTLKEINDYLYTKNYEYAD